MILRNSFLACPLGAMSRVCRGSMLLEAVVALGLIAAMTPVVYNHVAARKAEIEDINKANTFLLLQKQTGMYLKEDYANLISEINASGGNSIIKTPQDINPDFGDNLNRSYAVGIKKNVDNTLDAMIVELANVGKDSRAGKIAEMVGVSAGIYSSMDAENAWGLNGVWSEPVTDYFGPYSDLIPAGTTVVTTAYNKAKDKMYASDIFVDSDLDMDGYNIIGVDKIEAKELCLDGTNQQECIKKWTDIIELEGFRDAFKEGQSCANDVDCVSSGTSAKLVCLRSNGAASGVGSCANPVKIVEACRDGDTLLCSSGYSASLNRSCDEIRKTYTRMGLDPALDSEQIYRLATNASGGYREAKCWFPSGGYTNNNKMGYEGVMAVLNVCNTKKDLNACRAASAQQKHLNCQMTAYQYSVAGSPYQSPFVLEQPNDVTMTTNDSGSTTVKKCWFPNGYALGQEKGYEGDRALLEACRDTDNFACVTAVKNAFDIHWCKGWKSLGFTENRIYPVFIDTNRFETTCDMSKNPAWTRVALMSNDNQAYTTLFRANFAFATQGTTVRDYSTCCYGCTCWATVLGGQANGTKTYSAGQRFVMRTIPGGTYSYRCCSRSYPYTCSEGTSGNGPNGIALYEGASNLILVSGGAGGHGGGGGGMSNGGVFTSFNDCGCDYWANQGSGLGGGYGAGVGSGNGGNGGGGSGCRCASSCSGYHSIASSGFGLCSKLKKLNSCNDAEVPYGGDTSATASIYVVGVPNSGWVKPVFP